MTRRPRISVVAVPVKAMTAERKAPEKPKSWRCWVCAYADGIDGMVFHTRAKAMRWLDTTLCGGGRVMRATLTIDDPPKPQRRRKKA